MAQILTFPFGEDVTRRDRRGRPITGRASELSLLMKGASDEGVGKFVFVGVTADGDYYLHGSHNQKRAEILWLLEQGLDLTKYS